MGKKEQTKSFTVPYSAPKTYLALLNGVQKHAHFQIKERNDEGHTVQLSSGMSALSYGECITVVVHNGGLDACEVTVTSKSKFAGPLAIQDNGNNRKNIEELEKILSGELHLHNL